MKPTPATPDSLATIDLTNCTYIGRVLDPLELDREIEEQWFSGEDITVSVDGVERLTVRDVDRQEWRGGAAGIYGTSPARFRKITVRAQPEEHAAIVGRIDDREKEIQLASGDKILVFGPDSSPQKHA